MNSDESYFFKFFLEKKNQRVAQCSIKTEYCGSNYEEEDMMILEIVSELVMKEMEKIQSLINDYKSPLLTSTILKRSNW